MRQNGKAKSRDPRDYQQVARPVAALPNSYPMGTRIEPHTHARSQVLMAAGGVIEVTVDENLWIVPHGRAVWIPAGVVHALKVTSAVTLKSLYIDAAIKTRLGQGCQVIAVSELLHALISAAMEIPVEYELSSRDDQVMELILAELEGMPRVPLHAPMPTDPRLRTICQTIIDEPSRQETLGAWGQIVGATARTLANRFRAETGLTFGHWRQQVRLIEAVRRLTHDQSVSMIAHDLGYQDESSFIAMFRRTLGTTPARYFSDSARTGDVSKTKIIDVISP